ncbi:glycosyltransferase [Occultella aeris]|uniref:Teichuronic acid biosynthesis glycosyltransferase TuaC n=1 Tax=Occultella aeris TaxID=2761496 RepID=A0A7M4DNV7_9MICO|nr:glycosyltransferase [Occultella aeris]VZO39143.1 Putative teichuronic acid biosynthesis glycosyltransferase TuaC [Occultella aeris]
MRTVVLTTWYPTEVAPSSGTFVQKDVRAIAARPEVDAVDVVHLVPRHQDDGVRTLVRDGIRIRRVPMSTTSPLDIATVARSLPVLLEGADVVHTMAFSTLLPFAAFPPLVGTRPDAPWVHTEHWSALTSPQTLPLAARAALPALRPILGLPDVVTAVCEFLAAPIRRTRGADRPTEVVPCIVPPRAHLTARPMRPRTPMRLVAVGGLVERKDPLLAVDVLAELARRSHPAHLTWVGDGELREAVARHARKKKVAHLLTLAGGTDTAGVSAALDAADLFFLPTRAENFCVSAAEALVHGRPVVVGANGGQAEYIQDRVGAVVADQSAEAYADAVIATERATRHLNASDVAETVGDRFAPERVGAAYVAAYRRARDLGRG